jgi:hypothetical protein
MQFGHFTQPPNRSTCIQQSRATVKNPGQRGGDAHLPALGVLAPGGVRSATVYAARYGGFSSLNASSNFRWVRTDISLMGFIIHDFAPFSVRHFGATSTSREQEQEQDREPEEEREEGQVIVRLPCERSCAAVNS